MNPSLRTTSAVVAAFLLGLFFAGFGPNPTFLGALHADGRLAHDLLTGSNLGGDFYGTQLPEIWYSVRLIVISLMGGILIGFIAFLALVGVTNPIVKTALNTIVDIFELIPETMYIISLALVVILLIDRYQINIPGAFPVNAPSWTDTLIPALVLSIPSGLYVLRMLSISLRNEVQSDYVLTARSKGNSRWRSFTSHVLPNVLAQSMHVIPAVAAAITSSALFAEFFYGYQGLLFHLNLFADLNVNALNFGQKPRGIPSYNMGSVVVVCLVLIELWVLLDLISKLIKKLAFPVEAGRQPGVSMTRVNKPFLIIGGLILLTVVFAGCFPTLFTAHSPTQSFRAAFVVHPSRDFPFGTDDFGRDVLARILYGTPRTLVLLFTITLIITVGSLCLGILSMSLERTWLRRGLTIAGRIMSPLPALVILILAMLHRNMSSPYQTAQYVAWLSAIGIGRGAYAFQSAVSDWFSFGFIEGVHSVGVSKVRTVLTHLRPWVWRFTAEFTFAELIRVLAIMIELSAFHVFPTEVFGSEPYNFFQPPPGILDAHLTWLSLIGPISSYYSYISFPSVLFGPLIAFFAVTFGAGFMIKGIRGRNV